MLACPPYRGETSATVWSVGSRHVSPSPPEHRVMGRTWPCPPPRAITRRRTRCSPMEETRSGRPSSHTPIQAERSTPGSRAPPLGRNKTIGDGLNLPPNRNKTIRSWDRPLNREALSDRLALLPVPKRVVAESHFQSNLSHWTYWYVAGPCCTVSHNLNTMFLQCAPNLFNLLLIHTTNANTTVNLTVTVLNDFELKRDTVQPKNYLPAQ